MMNWICLICSFIVGSSAFFEADPAKLRFTAIMGAIYMIIDRIQVLMTDNSR